jgi:hypothetical protein
MLSWSVSRTGRTLDFRAVGDPDVDPGTPAGRLLANLARAALATGSDATPVFELAAVVGFEAATDAAAVAAAFEIYNRVIDATGVPVGKGTRRHNADLIETLGLDRFPHAAL